MTRVTHSTARGLLQSDGAGLVLLALPVAAYFWLIDRFSVNAVFEDQWSNVYLLHQWYRGNLGVADLWASHGDHRMLFPNFVVLALAEVTHFNVTVEEYLSAALVVATIALVVMAHRRRAPTTPLWKYLPVAVLFFSFVQFEDALWGFQFAWYLVTLAVVGAIVLLDRTEVTVVVFVAAVLCAVVASFSSLQGLIVWPVGLLMLALRGRSRRLVVIWCGLTVAITTIYFFHLHPSEYSDQTYLVHHPLASVKYFAFLVGSISGVQLTDSPWVELALGGALSALGVGLLVRYRHRDRTSARPVGLALIVYGLLFAASITEGRAWFGLWAPSRYSVCGLVILSGCYLVLLDRSEPAEAEAEADPGSSLDRAPPPSVPRRVAHRARSFGPTAAWVVVGLAMAAVVVFGTGRGYVSARQWSQKVQWTADVTANYKIASPALVTAEVSKGDPAFTRLLVETLETHRLSLFATAMAAGDRRRGLFPALTAMDTRVVAPARGATLHGTAPLAATASGLSGIRSVSFVATRVSDRRRYVLGEGRLAFYVWAYQWDTRAVPDGRYELTSIAAGPGGRTSRSRPVAVVVENAP